MFVDQKLIQAVLANRVNTKPEAEAVIDGDTRLTNTELQRRVDLVAKALLSLGVKHGDRVATLVPPSLDFWVIFLATTSIGAIWQGLNPRYQRNEYEYLLGDATPKVIFVREHLDGRSYLDELRELARYDATFLPLHEAPIDLDSITVDMGRSISDAALEHARLQVQEEDIAVIVYTSGTTGQPKGAMLSHRAIVGTAISNLAWMGEVLDCTVCPAPINHVGGLNNVCFTTFVGGGRIVFYPKVDMVALGEVNRQERPTYLVASPTAFAMLLAIPGFDFAAWDYYKMIVFGGAASPVAYLREVAKTGAKMSSVYGQTETTGMFTYTPLDASLEVMSETVGIPIAGNEIRIANDTIQMGPGEIGEIQARGVSMMSGYFNKPEATKEAFTADGWLRTGDLGLARPDGNIVFTGRLKEMFKSGGYNVYPVEVELAICEHPSIAQAAVVAVDHPTFQEVGHCFLLPHANTQITVSEIKAFLKERIADYKIPKSWTISTQFPYLPNGKLDKRSLAATLKD
jgi:acyl-CoA synthetase (AMP-forming)/AMP-acid ligase II